MVVIIPSIGGPERVVGESGRVEGPRADKAPAWTSDSKQLVVVHRSSPVEPEALFLLSIDAGEKRRMTSPTGAWGDSSPAFSPDGKTLAFVRKASWSSEDAFLLSLNADLSPAGEPRQLTSMGKPISGLSWSGKGEAIVLSSGDDIDALRLWKIPVSGGDAQPLAEDPAGEFLYYVKTLADHETALWKIPAGGGEESKVLESVVPRNFALALGGIYFMQAPDEHEPDGAYSIRFVNLADGRVEILARLPSNTVQLTQGLDVSPDGQSILYTQVDDISSDLMLIEGFE